MTAPHEEDDEDREEALRADVNVLEGRIRKLRLVEGAAQAAFDLIREHRHPLQKDGVTRSNFTACVCLGCRALAAFEEIVGKKDLAP